MSYKKYSLYCNNTSKSMRRESKKTNKRTTSLNSNRDILMKSRMKYYK